MMVSPSGLPFKHDRLPTPSSIRLLERLDPSPDGTLRFSLVTKDLDDTTSLPHICLSYTWGNPFAHGAEFKEHFDRVAPQYHEANRVRVLVNEHPMLIQKNLHDAMAMIPKDAYAEYANGVVDGTPGQTYLHMASYGGRPNNVENWFHWGADINKLDDTGHNALHYAADQGQLECVKVLLRYGCKSNVKDHQGKLPADLAREKGHDVVAAFIEAAQAEEAEKERGMASLAVASGRVPRPMIWADAICINQEDVVEKSTQVAMMDRIYSNAMYTLAWLGPPDDHSSRGIQVLNTLSTHLAAFKDAVIEPFSGKDKEKYAAANMPYISERDWASLASVYQRQWFRRAWIVQEAVLPGALLMYLGDQSLAWRALGQVSEAIRYNEARLGSSLSSRFIPAGDPAVSVVWNTAEVSKWRRFKISASQGGGGGDDNDDAKEPQSRFTLKHLVYNFWTFVASDPRDKVFAYYGLLNLYAAERHRADYGMGLAAIYTAATRDLIRSEASLAALSCCVYPLHRRKDLPSWVPDYSVAAANPVPRHFCADKGLQYVPPETTPDDPASSLLRVKGHFIGRVSAVGGRSGTRPNEKLAFDPSWLKLPLSLRGKGGYLPGASLSCILWTTLCMDTSPGGMFDPSVLGDKAPSAQGVDFRIFVLLGILAAGDALIRERLGLEGAATRHGDLVFSHLDYDPMKEDLEPVLADLDAFAEHDGDQCWLPTRAEVLRYWGSFTWGLLRNLEVESDPGAADFYLPPGVSEENARPVGNGWVVARSRPARRAAGFIAAYGNVYGGRHLVTVNERYLGLASLATRPGDEVWVLPGLNAPAVLRPSVDADDGGCVGRYWFMGAAYVSGLMHGEVVPLLKSDVEDIELV